MPSKIKRIPQHKLTNLDLIEPIPLDILGTDQDPCFGKLFNPKAPECQRCGDSEICAILTAQRNHVLRGKVEGTQDFMDMEETEITGDEDKKRVVKNVKRRIRSMVRFGGGNPVNVQEIINDCYASYSKDGMNKKKIGKILKKLSKDSSVMILKNDTLIWIKK